MSHPGQWLSALIDGELDGAQRDRVLAHLAGCDSCRRECAALRALKQRMTTLSEADADTSLVQRLLAMPPPAGEQGHPRRLGRRTAVLVAAASSVTVAGLATAAFLAGGGDPQPGPTVTPAVDVFMIQHAITPVSGPRQAGPSPRAGIPGAP